MPPQESFWFRVGYALERAKRAPAEPRRALASLAERSSAGKPPRRGEEPRVSLEEMAVSGAAALVGRVLDLDRGRPSVGSLLRAGAAGAGAALLLDLVRPLVRGEPAAVLDRGTGDRLLAGASQGLVYGAVVEPRVPGPAFVKGALYGSVEYAVDPVGGLTRLLGRNAPQRRLPFVSGLLEGLEAHERAYVEHVIFGVAVALLYGSSRSSNGMRIDDEDE